MDCLETVFSPQASDLLAFSVGENSLAIDSVSVEDALEGLSVGEDENPLAFFKIVIEPTCITSFFTLIYAPVLANIIEVGIIKARKE